MALKSTFARHGFKLPPTPNVEVFSMNTRPSSTEELPTTRLREEMTPSPIKESSYHSRYARDLQRTRLLSWTGTALSIVLVATGAAIVGCEAHALHIYNATHLTSQWFLPLWPQHFDLRPTIGIMIGGAVILFTNLCCLLCTFLSLKLPRTLLLSLLVPIFSFLGLAAACFATGYGAHIYTHSDRYNRDTLQSWTCRWAKGVSADSITSAAGTSSLGQNGGISPPSGFGKICLESHAAFDLAAIALCLEFAALVASVVALRMERMTR